MYREISYNQLRKNKPVFDDQGNKIGEITADGQLIREVAPCEDGQPQDFGAEGRLNQNKLDFQRLDIYMHTLIKNCMVTRVPMSLPVPLPSRVNDLSKKLNTEVSQESKRKAAEGKEFIWSHQKSTFFKIRFLDMR